MRYIVTYPVTGGFQFFVVVDKLDNDFAMASFSVLMPKARVEALALCDRLNESAC